MKTLNALTHHQRATEAIKFRFTFDVSLDYSFSCMLLEIKVN